MDDIDEMFFVCCTILIVTSTSGDLLIQLLVTKINAESNNEKNNMPVRRGDQYTYFYGSTCRFGKKRDI